MAGRGYSGSQSSRPLLSRMRTTKRGSHPEPAVCEGAVRRDDVQRVNPRGADETGA